MELNHNFKEGDILVRLEDAVQACNKEMGREGFIFRCIEVRDNKIHYHLGWGIYYTGVRLATFVEIHYFNTMNITNINQMPLVISASDYTEGNNTTPTQKLEVYADLNTLNFSVCIQGDKTLFNEFKLLCLTNKIPINPEWTGSMTFYGMSNMKPRVGSPSWGKLFHTVQEFKDYLTNYNKIKNSHLNNKNNEVSRENQKDTRGPIDGRSIVSKRTKQTAIGCRPIGNQTSVRGKRTRVKHSLICSNIISI